MDRSEPSSSTNTATGGAGSVFTAYKLPLVVVLANLLGGSTQRWAEGIILTGLGLLLIARPPRHSLGWWGNICALFFVALAAVSFLPAHWFFQPEWRTALTKDLGLHLPSTLSPQPWLTIDCFVTLIAGLAWVYYVATIELSLVDVRRAARWFAAGIIGLAALCIYLHAVHTSLPFWHNIRGFGPFPNRNQTGDLFAIATVLVLGCMHDDFHRRHTRWILWLAGSGVLVAALILNFSRAGILLLVGGVVAWLARVAFRKSTGAGIGFALSILLILFSGLLIFGGETIERFHLRLGSEGSVTSDYRWLIFRDVWSMIQSSPWCGIGLGNFENVFALFRHVSRNAERALHPESDWLWLWAEMGWPAIALVLAAVVLFVRRSFPLKEGTNQRFRYAALVGGLLFLLHGFVDVSGHRFGTFLAGTLLLGLAQDRALCLRLSRWPAVIFRIVGLALVVVGPVWFFTWRNSLLTPGHQGVENAKRFAIEANRGFRFRDALTVAGRGLEWAPLDWQLYFVRAVSHIGLGETPNEALADFRRARFLEPSAYQLPFEEGKMWLSSQPNLALSAWREALRREGAQEAGIYSLMFAAAAGSDPSVLAGLRKFALGQSGLAITSLENTSGDQFFIALQQLLANDPTLNQFNALEKARLFAVWSRRDPLDLLVKTVDQHPEWTQFAWSGLARYHAAQGDFETAWKLVRRFAPPPVLPETTSTESISALQQKLAINRDDYAVGYALFQAQRSAGKIDDALSTARYFAGRGEAPPYFYFLVADCWAEKGNWQRAWQRWQEYQAALEHERTS